MLYTGPSMLTGAPIVAVATIGTRNRKTGPMVQTWVLPASTTPTHAVRTGRDASVCGDCPHRGVAGARRTCYVVVAQAPQAVWRAWTRDRYVPADDAAWSRAVRGRAVRIGSYGDPAAVPPQVWSDLLASSGSGRWTGYTHAWRGYGLLPRTDARRLRDLVMASCDSVSDAAEAAADGWRAFIVRDAAELGADLGAGVGPTVVCPASPEGGDRSTCERCALCAGASARTAATRRQVPTGWVPRLVVRDAEEEQP